MPGSSAPREKNPRREKPGNTGSSANPGRRPAHRRPPARKKPVPSRLPSLIALLIAVPVILVAGLQISGKMGEETPLPEEKTYAPPPGKALQVVSSATLCSTGDLLMHEPIFGGGYLAECYGDGEYNFSTLFQYLSDYVGQYDYAVANLETTLAGPELPYQGYPAFNTPDQLVPALRSAGFDLLLTANNHCNDNGLPGMTRTLEVIRNRSMETLGTRLTGEEKPYVIADLNGIRLGMLCYTYEDSHTPGTRTLNGNPLAPGAENLVCTFPLYGGEEARAGFYQSVADSLSAMEAEGADASVIYLHWGEEYRLNPTEDQRRMAQKLCDLGVDVIIGSHPHVAEPVELLTSGLDESHKTVCLYSLGNAVSNQRLGNIDAISTAHTEDGMLFNCTFRKYSDGSTYLTGVEVIPTWVNMFGNAAGHREYNILPLDNSCRQQWKQRFDLSDRSLDAAWQSYERTMNIVGKGLGETNIWLSRENHQRQTGETPAA